VRSLLVGYCLIAKPIDRSPGQFCGLASALRLDGPGAVFYCENVPSIYYLIISFPGALMTDGLAKTENPPTETPLLGAVDLITRDRVIGWAFNPDHPNTPIMLEIMEREKLLLRITADEAREDLAEAGFGNGNYGFSARLPSDFSSDRLA
jgi:hypothetical protein